MTNLLLALCLGFAITAVFTPLLIPVLRKFKFGQTIRDDGPRWHEKKSGTPTMGGIAFILAYVVTTLVFAMRAVTLGDYRVPAIMIGAVMFGLIGFADDFIKIAKKRNLGLTSVQKLILQFLTSAAFLTYMYFGGFITRTTIYIPIANINFDLGVFFFPILAVLIVFISNSTNLTDGIDGLATSVSIPVFTLMSLLAMSAGAEDLSVSLGGMVGAFIAFLIFNLKPAKVFMGDTGSLFIGGLFALSAITMNMTLIVFVAGIIFVAESASVMLQVAYFKITKGKRLFKMAPIHHHFEMKKWSENKIVTVFTTVTLVFCLAAFFLFH